MMAKRHPVIPAERKGIKLLMSVRRNLVGYFVQLMRKEGAYAWMNLAGQNVLMMNDAAGIQHVLQDNAKNYKKSKFYHVLRPFLGNSILLSEGSVWKKQRHESAPAFSTKNLNDMASQMIDATEAMFKRWDNLIEEKKPIDLNFETMWFTLDVLLRALFHEAKDGIAVGMQAAVTTMLREAEERVWAPISLPQSITFRLPKYKTVLSFLNKTLHELVDARRKSKAYPDDLLSRLISGYGNSAEEQRLLRDQVMTFLLAGHETTANGLVWACYYLSRHLDVQRKMVEEVDRVVGNERLTLDHLKELVYTRQVFDEVLRFHPVVWTLSRDALSDDSIPLDDGTHIDVPQGTSVMLCTYAIHHREKYWKDPEAFDPDRFDTELSKSRPRFSFFPFGGGPRICLGLRFAQMESIIALAMIAQRYKVSLIPGQDIKSIPTITLRPNGPMLFEIVRRNSLASPSVKQTQIQPETLTKCPFAKVFS